VGEPWAACAMLGVLEKQVPPTAHMRAVLGARVWTVRAIDGHACDGAKGTIGDGQTQDGQRSAALAVGSPRTHDHRRLGRLAA
jgi:hypothetical protein